MRSMADQLLQERRTCPPYQGKVEICHLLGASAFSSKNRFTYTLPCKDSEVVQITQDLREFLNLWSLRILVIGFIWSLFWPGAGKAVEGRKLQQNGQRWSFQKFFESQDAQAPLLWVPRFPLAGALGDIPYDLWMGSWCQVAFDSPGQANSEEKNTCLLGVGHWAENFAWVSYSLSATLCSINDFIHFTD